MGIAATAVIFCVTMVILSLTVLFRINHIEVVKYTGTEYTSAQIAAACGIEPGTQNLFTSDPDAVAAKLEELLPYIGEAAVSRKFPSTLEISAEPTAAAAALDCPTGYLLIDKNGKMLEIMGKAPANVTVLKSSNDFEIKIGGYIKFGAATGADLLGIYKRIVAAVESAGLKDITLIDIREPREIKLMYQNRLTLYVGSDANIEQKLKTAVKTLKKEDDGSKTKTGTVDLSKVDRAYVIDGAPEPIESSGETVNE